MTAMEELVSFLPPTQAYHSIWSNISDPNLNAIVKMICSDETWLFQWNSGGQFWESLLSVQEYMCVKQEYDLDDFSMSLQARLCCLSNI